MVYQVCNPEYRFGRGTKHGAVRDVQEALNREGASPPLAVDGDFGRRTERAVLRFQIFEDRAQGVTGGIVDPQTLRLLKIWDSVNEKLKRAPIKPPHVDSPDWQAQLKYERISFGNMSLDPNTGQAVSVPGQAFKLIGYEALLGGRVENKNKVWIYHSKDDPDRSTVNKNECALLVQAFSVGATRTWRRGPQVRALRNIPRGTVVATLRDGVYYSDHSGRSHVGIFDSFIPGPKGPKGFRMYDQSNGRDISLSTFNFYDKYDRNEMVEKPKGKNGDFTIPVYDENNKLLGYTVIEHEYYAKNKFRWTSIGDEYYVMYSNDQPNLIML